MALSHSPKIVTANLVFYYDSDNVQKSWKGAPATNFFTNGHFSGGNGITQESDSNATNEVIVFSNPGNTEYVLRQTGTVASTEYQINLTTQLAASTTYVMSGWYAESLNYSSADGSRMFHSRAFSASGAHVATGNGIGTVLETKVLNGITWRYCYATITTPADYSNSFNWYVGYGPSAYTGHRYYTDIQMEVGSLPSRFINGTRSNTQAILDLTKRNTITATSLTYASNGAFSFNGSSNYIDGGNSSVLDVGNNITVNCWFFVNSTSSYQPIVAKVLSDFSSGWEIANSSGTFRVTLRPSATQINIVSGTLTIGNWYMGTMTFDNTTARLYLNGVEVGSSSSGGPVTLNSSQSLNIGRRIHEQYYNGNIAQVSIYSRALTAAEVLQNFNALRGRYGI